MSTFGFDSDQSQLLLAVVEFALVAGLAFWVLHLIPESISAFRKGLRDDDTPANNVTREERECPSCAELILVRAKICKHCGQNVRA